MFERTEALFHLETGAPEDVRAALGFGRTAAVTAELGCRLLVAETGAETDGSHNPSLHNMLRLGFRVAYERRNWVWQPAG